MYFFANFIPAPLTIYYLCLGSNVEPRENHLRMAIKLVQALPIKDLSFSQTYQSVAYSFSSPHVFFNVVVGLQTAMSPFDLLYHLQQIEFSLGKEMERPRPIDPNESFPEGEGWLGQLEEFRQKPQNPFVHKIPPEVPGEWKQEYLLAIQAWQSSIKSKKNFADRTIDIDLIFAENLVVLHPKLVLPHYDLRNRDFFLVPLLELAKTAKEPFTQVPYASYLHRLKTSNTLQVVPIQFDQGQLVGSPP